MIKKYLEPIFDIPDLPKGEDEIADKLVTSVIGPPMPELSTVSLVEAILSFVDFAPDIRQENLMEALVDVVLKNTRFGSFGKTFKLIANKTATELLAQLENVINGREMSALTNAYYDVARYRTDPKDAAIQWKVKNEKFLDLFLKYRPPPEAFAEKDRLKVPRVVKRLREFI